LKKKGEKGKAANLKRAPLRKLNKGKKYEQWKVRKRKVDPGGAGSKNKKNLAQGGGKTNTTHKNKKKTTHTKPTYKRRQKKKGVFDCGGKG